MLAIGRIYDEAKSKAYKTAFYMYIKHKGAESHIDNKYGVDVDDMYEIADILPPSMKEKYRVAVTSIKAEPDVQHAGYLKIHKIK